MAYFNQIYITVVLFQICISCFPHISGNVNMLVMMVVCRVFSRVEYLRSWCL